MDVSSYGAGYQEDLIFGGWGAGVFVKRTGRGWEASRNLLSEEREFLRSALGGEWVASRDSLGGEPVLAGFWWWPRADNHACLAPRIGSAFPPILFWARPRPSQWQGCGLAQNRSAGTPDWALRLPPPARIHIVPGAKHQLPAP
jgi:hypothetical protein